MSPNKKWELPMFITRCYTKRKTLINKVYSHIVDIFQDVCIVYLCVIVDFEVLRDFDLQTEYGPCIGKKLKLRCQGLFYYFIFGSTSCISGKF